MMSLTSTHCPYFSPNIFNDTKCQNCFRTKEIHLSGALEKQRGTRAIVKCGYLFVSPPNYELAENRSKRWQRRYFVLYDDGHLTYSLDEDPETVPQAVMDMNLVEEVIDADEVTGNQNAIGLRGPDQAVFIKSTSRREKMWWFDILSRYPKSGNKKKCSRAASGFSSFPSETRNEVKQPMLWLCFAANLSLSLAADPIGKDSAPSSTGSSSSINHHPNHNNNNNNKSGTGGSGNNNKNEKKDANMNNRVTGMQSEADRQQRQDDQDQQRSQQRNWINSNLSKTSQLTSIEVEEMRQKLNQARKELRNINKELRDSYANYDYLEIAYDKLRQQVRTIQEDRESELNLMRHRINDLTGKLRLAKHSLSRSQDRRRSEAGRHKLSPPDELPQDFGGKLQDLEHKIGTIHLLMTGCDGDPQLHPDRQTQCPSPVPPQPLNRRLSHDSDCSDSHTMLLRLHELSASVRKISDSLILYCDNTKPCHTSNSPSSSSSSSSSPSSSSSLPCCVVDPRPPDSPREETRF